ncbi:MAG: Ig-like domain-containing protein, partial [Planctomycetaceae bacterium]
MPIRWARDIRKSDGKIVAGGWAGPGGPADFALARYEQNGDLDTTFGGDGKVTTGFGLGSDEINALAFQSDGKIVAVGLQGSRGLRFAIARYGTDGALDTTFSGDGKATTDFSPRRLDGAIDVALQADGKILVAGVAGVGFGPGTAVGKFALVRYNPDGTRDSTFSDDGKTTTNFTRRLDAAGEVAIQADGKIVVVGTAKDGSKLATARFNADGTLD